MYFLNFNCVTENSKSFFVTLIESALIYLLTCVLLACLFLTTVDWGVFEAFYAYSLHLWKGSTKTTMIKNKWAICFYIYAHFMPILLLRHEFFEQTVVGKNLKTTDIQFVKIYCVFIGNYNLRNYIICKKKENRWIVKSWITFLYQLASNIQISFILP